MNKTVFKSSLKFRTLASLTLAQVLLLGCATDDASESEEQGSSLEGTPSKNLTEHSPTQTTKSQIENLAPSDEFLVARVEHEQFSLSFYSAQPGELLEFETGRMDLDHPPESPDFDSVQRYEFLTGQKAPAALVEAAVASGQEGHVGEPIPSGLAIQKGNGSTTPNWFKTNYCTKTDRFWGTGPNSSWWNSNSWFSDGVEMMKAGAYTWQGYIHYKMSYSGSGLPNQWYGLPSGHYAGFRATSTIDRSARSEVSGALGSDNAWVDGPNDQYMHCVNYHY